MKNFKFERAIVRSVDIVEGSPVCIVENRDRIDRTHEAAVLTQTPEQIILPPVGSEVLIGKVKGVRVIFGVLTPPREEPTSTQDIVTGAENGHGSVSFLFGPRDGAPDQEKFEINHTSSGYEITADVDSTITLKTDGDITLQAGGDILIDNGGTPKEVATADHTHSFSYDGGGDNSSSKTGSTDKTTETTTTKID